MGTNYYAVRSKPSMRNPIHIGKSSVGWLFCFQSQNDKWNDPPVVWETYDEVRSWLYKHVEVDKDYVIMNEYDEIVPFDVFFKIVDEKQADEHDRSNPENFEYSNNVGGYRFNNEDFW